MVMTTLLKDWDSKMCRYWQSPLIQSCEDETCRRENIKHPFITSIFTSKDSVEWNNHDHETETLLTLIAQFSFEPSVWMTSNSEDHWANQSNDGGELISSRHHHDHEKSLESMTFLTLDVGVSIFRMNFIVILCIFNVSRGRKVN